MHPDGQVVAVRIESIRGSAPPLLCELETESIRLVAPDAATRREWLTTLIGVARGLFQILPRPMFDGQPALRVTVLPAPAEISDQNPSSTRLRHIGKLGKALLDDPPPGPSGGDDSATGPDDECRLFFDYLRRDFKQAQTELDVVAARATAPRQRFALLALRAQILMGQGLAEQARAVIDYLLHSGYSATQRVEETPAGPIFTPADGPGRIWASYLSRAASQKPTAAMSLTGQRAETTDEGVDLRFPDPALNLNRKANAGRVNNPFRLRLRVPDRGPAGPLPRGLQRVFPPPPPQPAGPVPPGRPGPRRLGQG
jgi:hypothetical protein